MTTGGAAVEIEQFKREMIERTGDITAGDKIDESTLLREVMNTVGKKGRLGEQIGRKLVSGGISWGVDQSQRRIDMRLSRSSVVLLG